MTRAGLILMVLSACGFTVPGQPDALAPPIDTPPDMPVLGPCEAVEVAAGGDHTCARAGDGSVYCWGRASNGELGVSPAPATLCMGTTSGLTACSSAPVQVTMPPAVALGLGTYHSCAATGNTVYCWGYNGFGAYGNGTMSDASPTVMVSQRSGATALSVGVFHTCSLSAGRVLCSGKNEAGEVGNNSAAVQTTATEVSLGATSVGAGAYTSCAIDAAGALRCWGRNEYKQIDGTQLSRLVPTLVAGITGATQVAAGVNHICVVRRDHSAMCWGSNAMGQLGNGMTTQAIVPPVLVAVPNVAQVAASLYHTCVLDAGGAVWCFGESYTPTPTKIALPSDAIGLATGERHDCAVTADHRVWCWGAQDLGQLGNKVSSGMPAATPQEAKLCP